MSRCRCALRAASYHVGRPCCQGHILGSRPLLARACSMLARAAKAPRSGRRACGFHKTFKRRDSPYRWGRSRDWIKSKKPNAPAVKRRPKTSQLGETCIDEL